MADSKVEDDAIDLRGIALQIWRRRWWVVASTLIFAVVSVVALNLITPIYSASTVLISASSERSNLSGTLSSALGQLGGGLASLAGANLGSNDSPTEEALAVLRSRQFNEQFILDLKLMPELYYNMWDAANARWKVSPKHQPTPAKAVKYFRSKVETISQDKRTGLITLQILWKDRQRAVEWANILVQRLNLEMRRREMEKADASISFLEKELSTTNVVETREAISRLIEEQVKQRMLANVTPEYAFRVVDTAMPPDADDPISPSKPILLLGGPLLGLVVGIMAAFVLSPSYKRTLSQ